MAFFLTGHRASRNIAACARGETELPSSVATRFKGRPPGRRLMRPPLAPSVAAALALGPPPLRRQSQHLNSIQTHVRILVIRALAQSTHPMCPIMPSANIQR